MRRAIGIITFSIGLLVGCDGNREPETTQAIPTAPTTESVQAVEGTIHLRVTFAPWQRGPAKATAALTIDAATAYVYDDAGTEVTNESLSLSEGRASGRITVQAHDDLRVTLVYLGGTTVRYIGEDVDVDVPAGGETVAEIMADYMGTSVTAPESAEVGVGYAVSWMARPHSTGYELQEATSEDFSGAVSLYAGTGVSFDVPPKDVAGVTYYYRARTTTVYGNGPWHSTGSAATGIFAEEGTIIIDVPIPPDEPGNELTIELPGGATMEFVWIEPGTFTMGSPSSEPDRSSNEGPQQEVTISQGFWLGKYEITQSQWEAVVGTTPWSGQSNVQVNSQHPAVYVSGTDVAGLIDRLNAEAGGTVYRLPTEAEWEYACRAGTTTRWSFGDDEEQLADYAWYYDNAWNAGLQYAQPVGTKLPNPWGLYDMHGNVWEWVQDWYGSYSSGAQVDPQGPSTGDHRVDRGGGFGDYTRNTRAAYRGYTSLSYADPFLGARLLRTP